MGRTIGALFARWYPLFGDTFELFLSERRHAKIAGG